MPNIFNADNGVVSGSAGIKLSSDTSGVLNIQTNGTTAISISASQVVSFPATSGFSFAGQVTFAAGTAAAPSISVTGDTNTGIYFPAADTIAFAEGGVESARFDSSGNFGLGVTPSAVDSNYRSAQVGNAAYIISGNNQYASFAVLSANAFYNTGSTFQYKNTGFATRYQQNDGQHIWYTAPSGTAGNAITFTQAMTLDASGNLLLGTSSYTEGAFNVYRSGSSGSAVVFYNAGTGTTASDGFYVGLGGANAVDTYVYSRENAPLVFGTNNTERARIDASGYLLVGATSTAGVGASRIQVGSTSQVTSQVLAQSSTTHVSIYAASTADVYQAVATGSNLIFGNGPANGSTFTERARITSAGRLGVGTSSPSYNFQVQKTSLAAPAIMIGGAFYGGPRLQVYGLDADANGWMGLGTDMAGNPYEHSIYFPDTGSAGILTFGTYNGTTYTTRMSLTRTGNLNVTGALSKGSGSFRIPHPLKEETHDLVHSFIEGPQADLIYSGKVQLEDGKATVNIDVVSGMTEGTFVVLCRDIRCFTNNETDWDNVRGKVVGNLLTIECQNPDSDAIISWMVIGERQDKHMYDTDWTDENGKVIVEPVRPVIKKGYN